MMKDSSILEHHNIQQPRKKRIVLPSSILVSPVGNGGETNAVFVSDNSESNSNGAMPKTGSGENLSTLSQSPPLDQLHQTAKNTSLAELTSIV